MYRLTLSKLRSGLLNVGTLVPIGFICVLLLASGFASVLATDSLTPQDFLEQSWTKTVDFFDYARNYAAANGLTPPSNDTHAYVHMTYINVGSLQVLNWGLDNITAGTTALTLPTQSTLMHFKTQNQSKDVVSLSTFLMLMAFNDSATGYPGSPDVNDTLYASFSLGFNLNTVFPDAVFPSLNCTTSYIPLTHSTNMLNWSWGMRYTDLTAFWWRVFIDPLNPHYEETLPMGIAVYDELTFTYNLTINPQTHSANLTENHVIGRIRDLYSFGWTLTPIPRLYGVHYNGTGHYWLNGTVISGETIYEHLTTQKISMSIVDFRTTILADQETQSQTPSGSNVTNDEVDVSDSYVSTCAHSGEKISDASFGVKKMYKLFNYTAYSDETVYQEYDAVTRTCEIGGYAGNPIFASHALLMKFYPLLVAHMNQPLYDKAKTYFAGMTHADYFYVMSYPTYGGYRVEHDPVCTVYFSGEVIPEFPQMLPLTALLVAVAFAVLLKRQKNRLVPN